MYTRNPYEIALDKNGANYVPLSPLVPPGVNDGQGLEDAARTRDAWLLDPEDNFVVCLCREGEPQPFRIIDVPDTFAIEGTASPKMACLLRS